MGSSKKIYRIRVNCRLCPQVVNVSSTSEREAEDAAVAELQAHMKKVHP